MALSFKDPLLDFWVLRYYIQIITIQLGISQINVYLLLWSLLILLLKLLLSSFVSCMNRHKTMSHGCLRGIRLLHGPLSWIWFHQTYFGISEWSIDHARLGLNCPYYWLCYPSVSSQLDLWDVYSCEFLPVLHDWNNVCVSFECRQNNIVTCMIFLQFEYMSLIMLWYT